MPRQVVVNLSLLTKGDGKQFSSPKVVPKETVYFLANGPKLIGEKGASETEFLRLSSVISWAVRRAHLPNAPTFLAVLLMALHLWSMGKDNETNNKERD